MIQVCSGAILIREQQHFKCLKRERKLRFVTEQSHTNHYHLNIIVTMNKLLFIVLSRSII